MVRILRLHHLTVAVRDSVTARATFEQLFEVDADDRPARDLPAFRARAADLTVGDQLFEFSSPNDGSAPLMRFLQQRGEGLYAIGLEVDDLDAAVVELTSQGVRVSKPVEARAGVRSAFVSMAVTHGVSIELVEVAAQHADAAPLPGDEPVPPGPASHEKPVGSPPGMRDLTPDEWSDVD